MEEKLKKAYDRMTMPAAVSARIQDALAGKRERGWQYRYFRPSPRKSVLPQVLAAACFALALVAGTAALARSPAQSLRPSETAATEPAPGPAITLTGEDLELLRKMCLYMPDWQGYENLDADFWRQFLFASFTSPESLTDTTAQTILGALPYQNGEVLLTREQAEGYVKEILGVDLPEFPAGGAEDSTNLNFFDGCYHIHLSDFGDVDYRYLGTEILSDESGMDYLDVSFGGFLGDDPQASWLVNFTVGPGDTQRGFLIVGKTSRSLEASFAGDYAAGDTGEIGLEIREREDGTFQLRLNVYRVTSLEGEGVLEGGVLSFSSQGGETGTVKLEGDTALVTITSPGWPDGISSYRYTRIPENPKGPVG